MADNLPNCVIICILYKHSHVDDSMTSKSEEAFQIFKTSVKFESWLILENKKKSLLIFEHWPLPIDQSFSFYPLSRIICGRVLFVCWQFSEFMLCKLKSKWEVGNIKV